MADIHNSPSKPAGVLGRIWHALFYSRGSEIVGDVAFVLCMLSFVAFIALHFLGYDDKTVSNVLLVTIGLTVFGSVISPSSRRCTRDWLKRCTR